MKLLKNALYYVFAWNEMTKQSLIIDIQRFLRFARGDSHPFRENDSDGRFSGVS